jgi:hypothetical protein
MGPLLGTADQLAAVAGSPGHPGGLFLDAGSLVLARRVDGNRPRPKPDRLRIAIAAEANDAYTPPVPACPEIAFPYLQLWLNT